MEGRGDRARARARASPQIEHTNRFKKPGNSSQEKLSYIVQTTESKQKPTWKITVAAVFDCGAPDSNLLASCY